MKRKTFVLQGQKISSGIAVGRASIRLDDFSVVPAYGLMNEAEVEAEIQAFRTAVNGADQDATVDLEWARGNLPKLEAEIFAAQRALLRDPSLSEYVEARIRDRRENAALHPDHASDKGIDQHQQRELPEVLAKSQADPARRAIDDGFGHTCSFSSPLP